MLSMFVEPTRSISISEAAVTPPYSGLLRIYFHMQEMPENSLEFLVLKMSKIRKQQLQVSACVLECCSSSIVGATDSCHPGIMMMVMFLIVSQDYIKNKSIHTRAYPSYGSSSGGSGEIQPEILQPDLCSPNTTPVPANVTSHMLLKLDWLKTRLLHKDHLCSPLLEDSSSLI